jgi:hypothetical protein
MVPASNGEVFLLRSPTVAQAFVAIHLQFFFIHTTSTENRRLSARFRGYPPAYAQAFHRLPYVIQRALT